MVKLRFKKNVADAEEVPGFKEDMNQLIVLRHNQERASPSDVGVIEKAWPSDIGERGPSPAILKTKRRPGPESLRGSARDIVTLVQTKTKL